MKNNRLIKILTSYYEINKSYVKNKQSIDLIIINKDMITIKGFNEIQTFNKKEFMKYLKTEIIINFSKEDLKTFKELMNN